MTKYKKNQEIHISELEEKDIKKAAELLNNAFDNEGITKYVHNKNKSKNERAFNIAGELKLKLYLATSQKVFVAKQGQKIIGCFILKYNEISFLNTFRIYFPKIMFVLIPINTSMNLKKAYKLPKLLKIKKKLEKPYFTLEIIAVEQKHQGKGIGKLLLQKIDELLYKKIDIKGVYLFTADKKNKEIYGHKGYKLIEENKSDEITIYHMFKAKTNQKGRNVIKEE